MKIIEKKTASSKPKDDGENNHNKPKEKETPKEESDTESNKPEEKEFATESNKPGKGPGIGNGNSKMDDPGWARHRQLGYVIKKLASHIA